MGTVIVGGGLLLIVVAIVFNMIRRHRQGKSILCDGVSCSACGASAFCQSDKRMTLEKGEQVVHFVRQRTDGSY